MTASEQSGRVSGTPADRAGAVRVARRRLRRGRPPRHDAGQPARAAEGRRSRAAGAARAQSHPRGLWRRLPGRAARGADHPDGGRLVAASERPNLKYKATILNSPAINAFALPNGQLYVTRGLLALANDTSELASVLSHEMAHVIARHAAIREDQVRQAALVSRVASDVFNDPQMGALALARSKIALASFSRAQELEADGVGVGISARAGFDPYGAVRFLTAMGRNAELRAARQQRRRPALPRLPLLASRRRPTGSRSRAPMRASSPRRATCARDRTAIWRASTACPTARTRAKAMCAAAASCIRASASPSRRRTASRWRTPRRPCSACATAAISRCGSTWCACRPSRRSGQYLALRLDRERRRQVDRGVRDQRPADRDRARQGRPMVVPALRHPLRRRGLPLHLRRQAADAGCRPRVPLFGHDLPPHDARARSARRARCACTS